MLQEWPLSHINKYINITKNVLVFVILLILFFLRIVNVFCLFRRVFVALV